MKYRHSLLELLCALLAWIVAVPLSPGEQGVVKEPVQNAGFEQPMLAAGARAGTRPVGWMDFSSGDADAPGVSTSRKSEGDQAVLLKCPKIENAYYGIFQEFPVEPGKKYTVKAQVINDAGDPIGGQSYGQLTIEWKTRDADPAGLARSRKWNYELSATRWQEFRARGTAPRNADHAAAVITFYAKDGAGYGSCYIDDVEIIVEESTHQSPNPTSSKAKK